MEFEKSDGFVYKKGMGSRRKRRESGFGGDEFWKIGSVVGFREEHFGKGRSLGLPDAGCSLVMASCLELETFLACTLEFSIILKLKKQLG